MNPYFIKQTIQQTLEENKEQLSESCIDNLALAMSDMMTEHIELRNRVKNDCINSIHRKREVPELHGKKLHDFKNEFNTLFQTLGRLQFEDVSKGVLMELCLCFAGWGAKNLSGIISKDEK